MMNILYLLTELVWEIYEWDYLISFFHI